MSDKGAGKKPVKHEYFIAILLPDHICQELHQQVQSAAERSTVTPHLRHAGDYHISVAFPGRLTHSDVQAIKAAMDKIDVEAFKMQLEGLMWFPREQNRRRDNNHVIWTSPDNIAQNSIREIFLMTKKHLREAGYEAHNEDKTPHVTIAYWPVSLSTMAKDFLNEAQGDVKTGEWEVDGIGLYRIRQHDDPNHPANNEGEGSRYQLVHEVKLPRPL